MSSRGRSTSPTRLTREGDVEGLVALLGDSRRRRRLAAAGLLRRFPGPRSESALLGALDDPDYLVSQTALASLAALDEWREPRPIVEALRRREGNESGGWPPSPRELVELGAWRLRALDPVSTLIQGIRNGNLAAEDDRWTWLNQKLAFDALARLGDRRATKILASELGLGDPDVRVSSAAADALGRLGDEAAVSALARALDADDKRVRRAAARALARIGSADAVEALGRASKTGSLRDRWAALRQLRRAHRERA